MDILELLYYLGFIIKKSYKTRLIKQLPHKVISVGNLTTGGTGKTPLVIAISNEAVKRGYKPCILTRGYKGRVDGIQIVSIGEGVRGNFYDLGDEPVLIANRTTGVKIIKSADRYAAGMSAGDSNLFILDDGFQHFGLHRDIDIVLVDSLKGFDNEKLLPFGQLREPFSGLSRAHFIIKTLSGHVDNRAIDDIIREYSPKAYIYTARHKAACLVDSEDRIYPLEEISGKKVFAFCAIGNPEGFRMTLKELGTDIVGFKVYSDHYTYNDRDIDEIVEAAGSRKILTTEKDLLKIERNRGILAIRIDFDIDSGFYDRLFKEV